MLVPLACAGTVVLAACPGGSSDDEGASPTGIDSASSGPETGGSTDVGGTDGSDDGVDTGGTGLTDDGPSSATNPTQPPDDDGPGTDDTSGDDGMLDCTGDPLETLPIDSSGWIPRECTIFDIQGSWYCFDDGVTETSCAAGAVPYEGDAMCLSGTAMGPVAGAWGGGIGVGLNESGEAMSIKMPYDAAANGVLGFAVEVSGDTGGNPLRVGFTGSSTPSGPSPFVEIPGAGAYDVMLADAIVPEAWMLPESGDTPDPSAIYDVQVQIAADTAAGPFDFCITSLTPITEGGGGGDDPPPPFGSEVCGQYDTIELTDRYLVSNNVWNDAVYAGGGSQCTTALWDGASDVAGFIAEPDFSVATSAPGSYPSIVYGWHWDSVIPGPYDPEPISGLTSIPSEWSWEVPDAGTYNVAYDLWMHPDPAVTTPHGGLELMIWTQERGGIQPIGTYQGYTVDFEGATWEVWYGSPGGWNTVSYRRVGGVSSVDMDLLPFVDHAVGEGWAGAGWSLLGVEAGFEIWEGHQPMTTTSFRVGIQ